MRIKTLILEHFGPFDNYQIDIPSSEEAFVLLCGQNNAGKSSVIRALKLLSSAMNFARQTDEAVVASLPKKETADIEVGRLIHNYEENGMAFITGILDSNREIRVTLDASNNDVKFELPRRASRSMTNLFGFIPPLGQLAEREVIIRSHHLLDSLNTTLAPHHLRNHIFQLLNNEQKELVKNIVNNSWDGIKLGDLTCDKNSGILYCLYREGLISHEIAWAGQGLQIWIQIITHMVRLSETSILVLDEPEIFLHPRQQHALIQVLKEYYHGSVIMATHSSEIMNDFDISHIIHVQKNAKRTKVFQISDRSSLEKLRGSIGSTFNLIASQFENVELLIATEYQQDYEIIHQLAILYGINVKTQNVRVTGFNNRQNAANYKQAYSLFFGRSIDCSLLLDRDYYPNTYLDEIKKGFFTQGVRVFYTPGKEIENLLLNESVLIASIPKEKRGEFKDFLNHLYITEHDNSFIKYVEFYKKYSPDTHKEISSIYRDIKPVFDAQWNNINTRHNLVAGKPTLAKIRAFVKEHYNINLPTINLIKALHTTEDDNVKTLISEIFTINV